MWLGTTQSLQPTLGERERRLKITVRDDEKNREAKREREREKERAGVLKPAPANPNAHD